MKNLTPQHLRCAPLHCPSVHELEDGRLRIVGEEDANVAGCGEGERAIIIDRELLAGVHGEENAMWDYANDGGLAGESVGSLPRHAPRHRGGTGMSKATPFSPGTLGCHEALDRTSILADQVENLSEHPAIMLNPEWRRIACAAAELLADLYQKIGAVHLTADEAAVEEVEKDRP